MRTEYDMSGGVRGKFANRFSRDVHYVAIDPDVAAYFSDGKAINNALRGLIQAFESTSGRKRA